MCLFKKLKIQFEMIEKSLQKIPFLTLQYYWHWQIVRVTTFISLMVLCFSKWCFHEKNGKLGKQPPKKVFCFSYIFYLLFKWMLLLLDPMLAYFTMHLRYVFMYTRCTTTCNGIFPWLITWLQLELFKLKIISCIFNSNQTLCFQDQMTTVFSIEQKNW